MTILDTKQVFNSKRTSIFWNDKSSLRRVHGRSIGREKPTWLGSHDHPFHVPRLIAHISWLPRGGGGRLSRFRWRLNGCKDSFWKAQAWWSSYRLLQGTLYTSPGYISVWLYYGIEWSSSPGIICPNRWEEKLTRELTEALMSFNKLGRWGLIIFPLMTRITETVMILCTYCEYNTGVKLFLGTNPICTWFSSARAPWNANTQQSTRP